MNIKHKKDIKFIEEELKWKNISTYSLLEKIEETDIKENIFNIFGKDAVFPAASNDTYWNSENKITLEPKVWRAIYKYSDEYGELDHTNCDYSIIGDKLFDENINVLDFGCGPNPDIDKKYKCNFYLIEVNDKSRQKLSNRFLKRKNIYIFEGLSELINRNIKFDIIYSKDCLEHVRHINEHIILLYRLCKDEGMFMLQFPYGNYNAGHVSTLYEDTILDDVLKKAFLI